MRTGMKSKTAERTALCGVLVGMMLVLGIMESLLPALPGVPGAKLGLANSVLLYGIYALSPGITFMLMVLKVVLSGLLFGGVNAMAYSFAGGLLSLLLMLLVKRAKGVSVIGVSMTGAVFHNVGQVAVAMLVLSTTKLLYYMAALMIIGLVTGLMTGTIAMLVMKHLGIKVPLPDRKVPAVKKPVPHEV